MIFRLPIGFMPNQFFKQFLPPYVKLFVDSTLLFYIAENIDTSPSASNKNFIPVNGYLNRKRPINKVINKNKKMI